MRLWASCTASVGDLAQRASSPDYTRTVHRLIQAGHWYEMPAPEDHLPDDWVPKEFFEY